MDRLPLLVLVRNITRTLSYYHDWQDALLAHPAFDADIEDVEQASNHPRIRAKIEKAPFVVALHGTNGNGTAALDALSNALRSRRGKLAVFVGNEVNLAYPTMRSKLDMLKAVQPELIATTSMSAMISASPCMKRSKPKPASAACAPIPCPAASGSIERAGRLFSSMRKSPSRLRPAPIFRIVTTASRKR